MLMRIEDECQKGRELAIDLRLRKERFGQARKKKEDERERTRSPSKSSRSSDYYPGTKKSCIDDPKEDMMQAQRYLKKLQREKTDIRDQIDELK